MKIRVQREDGGITTIDLDTYEWHTVEGQHLNRLSRARLDFYFTSDGYYDGSGRLVDKCREEPRL